MDNELFIKNYVNPLLDGLDRKFTLPLPDAESLVKTAEFIVQSHCPPTYSTNIITRHESPATGIRLVEVYKSSQNMDSGKFVRLVGTMALVKKGHPFLFLDAAITNIDMQTGEAADINTRIAVHMPQADDGARQALMDTLSRQATEAGLNCGVSRIDALPAFWGPLWHVRVPDIALYTISKIRFFAWQAYQAYCAATAPAADFDYSPVQVQMILKNSKAEQGQFLRMGLDVPVEVQAAFFSVLCTGI